MGILSYTAITSLDGYVADASGRWDWSVPDAEVHAFVNDLERPIRTHVYGRRLYEVMTAWETIDDPAPEMRDYAAVWRAADKVVISRTLREVTTARTRLEHSFDAEAIRALADHDDVSIGGPELAAQAIATGIVDECRLIVSPVVVGGGKPAFPDGTDWPLELVDERRFANGVVFLRYVPRSSR
jgi:dihydrofolate reductase